MSPLFRRLELLGQNFRLRQSCQLGQQPDAWRLIRVGEVVKITLQGSSGSLQANAAPILTPAHLLAHLPPTLVALSQGGLTLGPEQGELGADFTTLGC
jgi:hypothetical protein